MTDTKTETVRLVEPDAYATTPDGTVVPLTFALVGAALEAGYVVTSERPAPATDGLPDEGKCSTCGDAIARTFESGEWADVNGLRSCAPHADVHTPTNLDGAEVGA